MRPGRSIVLLLMTAMLATACRQKMADQPHYNPYEPSDFFGDGRSARPLVAGTVARGQLNIDSHLDTGRVDRADSDQAYAETLPFPVTRSVLERGQERYNIFCAVCHDRVGMGNGVIVRRGLVRPPSFHTSPARGWNGQLRDAPVGYYFQVITRGHGAMPDYREQIPVEDRWSIIAYVRALQLSQSAGLEQVPAAVREQLERGGDE